MGDPIMAQARKKLIRQRSPPNAAATTPGRTQRWQVAGFCLGLAAITFAVFGQTAGFGFVKFDDNVYVYENATVAGGLSLKGLAWAFTHADCYLYHPLTILSLMGDYQLHGLHAGGYHFTNVVLHAASVILLFLILRQMTGALWRSVFVAAVFAIHPLRVESVAWVAERKDVLGTFFFMLTLCAYARYVRNPNSRARYLMVGAAFMLALLSKPTVVTLPFVLLLLDYWPLHRFEQPGPVRQPEYFGIPRRLILEKIPLLALAAGACAMTVLTAEKAIAADTDVSLPARIGNALVSYAVYLGQMVWPEGLAVYYPRPEQGYPVWTATLSFLLLALITGGVLAFGRKRRWLLTGWLWYLGVLMPMIGIVPVGEFAHADRMTYLPQIGLYLMLTWTVADLSAGWRYRGAALGGLAAVILVALGICARTQTAYWRESEILWTHALACTTDNYMAHLHLGNALFQRGRLDEAIAEFQTALRIKPLFAEAHYNLGDAFLKEGRVDEAITEYQEALHVNPNYAEAHNNLGNILLQKGGGDEAILHFQKALQIKPDYAAAHLDLGIALRQKGRMDEAIAQYQQALQIKPDYAEAFYNLGNALQQMGRVSDAITQYQMALQIEPANPAILNNLAWLLATSAEASLRNGNMAVELAERANSITGGENAVVLKTLAAACAEVGRFSEATETAQRALQLAEARSNTTLAGALQSEIKLYQAGSPIHIPEQTQ
jgi:protein O-mannosyl-transferase